MKCTNCHTVINANDSYCGQCGKKLHHLVWQHRDIMEAISEDDTELNFYDDELIFVGKNSSYYDMKWQSANEKKRKNSFNWASFFLSFFWLGYRKMYKYIALFSLLFLLCDFVLYLVGYEYSLDTYIDPADQLIGLATGIFFGFYGNQLYKSHVDKQVAKIRNGKKNAPKEKYALFRSDGGTAWYGPILSVLIILGVYIIPTQLIPINIAPIDEVKYGYYMNPDETFQEIFSDVFTDGEWTEVEDTYGYSVVEFHGDTSLNGESQDVTIHFKNVKDEEQLYMEDVIVNGYEYNGEDVYGYLDRLLADYGYVY